MAFGRRRLSQSAPLGDAPDCDTGWPSAKISLIRFICFRTIAVCAMGVVAIDCDCAALANEQLTTEELRFFEAKIRPVLVKHCYACHSADAKEIQGDLRLDTRDGIRKGGDSRRPEPG